MLKIGSLTSRSLLRVWKNDHSFLQEIGVGVGGGVPKLLYFATILKY